MTNRINDENTVTPSAFGAICIMSKNKLNRIGMSERETVNRVEKRRLDESSPELGI